MQNYVVIALNYDEEDEEEIIYEHYFDFWHSAEEKFDILTHLHSNSTSLIEVQAYCVNPTGDFGSDTHPPRFIWWNAAMNEHQINQYEETISLYDPDRKFYVRMSRSDIEYINACFGTFEILT
jgi:hypothetical protein